MLLFLHAGRIGPGEDQSNSERHCSSHARFSLGKFEGPDDPSVAWMDVDISVLDKSSMALRFNLHGNPISPADSLKLPTHLGLHHHAAECTLDDIFLLSRSTFWNFCSHRAPSRSIKKGGTSRMEELVGKEDELRRGILAAGVKGMSSRGNVGMRAIDIVWECIVGWSLDVEDLEGIALDSTADTAIDSLPMEFFLPQIATTLTRGDAGPESAIQLIYNPPSSCST
ncbi:hypothetical protein CPC08DRAFT_755888 [Agrocybe pediades]|nr:hypothetical protein CPC08DRAFT_755888 [Agrocybe pediades]